MATRFGETTLAFKNPDGMRLALVAVSGAEREPAWSDGEVPPEHAIRGFHSVTLVVADAAPTAAILTNVPGFSEVGREGATVRLRTRDTAMGGIVDIRAAGGIPRGRVGGGSVHHVAFRAADDATEMEMARKLAEDHGIRTTEQKDRNYFRGPGGVLFDIATDEPGFAVDEPIAALGGTLKLPPFLEPRRAQIEATLPEVS